MAKKTAQKKSAMTAGLVGSLSGKMIGDHMAGPNLAPKLQKEKRTQIKLPTEQP